MSNIAEMVYLDYAASTPADPRVVDVMTPLFGAGGDFANPSSGHTAGRRSSAHVERTGRVAWLQGGATGLDVGCDGVG
jgi:cysteine desulfurase